MSVIISIPPPLYIKVDTRVSVSPGIAGKSRDQNSYSRDSRERSMIPGSIKVWKSYDDTPPPGSRERNPSRYLSLRTAYTLEWGDSMKNKIKYVFHHLHLISIFLIFLDYKRNVLTKVGVLAWNGNSRRTRGWRWYCLSASVDDRLHSAKNVIISQFRVS